VQHCSTAQRRTRKHQSIITHAVVVRQAGSRPHTESRSHTRHRSDPEADPLHTQRDRLMRAWPARRARRHRHRQAREQEPADTHTVHSYTAVQQTRGFRMATRPGPGRFAVREHSARGQARTEIVDLTASEGKGVVELWAWRLGCGCSGKLHAHSMATIPAHRPARQDAA
jgi:hypothetical protein